MIFEILNNYSLGELAEIIGTEIIEGYEKIIGESVAKADLVSAVSALYGFELLSQKQQRETLIERMSEAQVQKLIESFRKENQIKIPVADGRDAYKLLSMIADRWTSSFILLFGFENILESQIESDNEVRGIFTIESSYPMYSYQRDMVNKIGSLMRLSKDRRCLLHLPTGAGKTRTAMNIASEHLRTREDGLVLWLADTSELCAQASDEFLRAWKSLGNRSLKLYSFYSDTNISLGGVESGFLVAGLQKLKAASDSEEYKILYQQLRKYVTLIIFDEAHKVIAPTYSNIVSDMINTERDTILLGLSATPGRKLENDSDEDEKLTQFFEGKKVTMQIAGYESPIKYLVDNQYLAKANFINIEYDGSKIQLAKDFFSQKRSGEIRKALSEDECRNIRLLKVIGDEHERGSSIIVFACSVEHSRILASFLAFKGIKAHSLDSKYDNTETRRKKISDYIKGDVRVLVNFNILTAGFDAPRTSVVVIARPTDSLVQYSQMAGRAMRGVKSGGNLECKIYTVRDDIPAFRSVIQAFTHWDRLWSEA